MLVEIIEAIKEDRRRIIIAMNKTIQDTITMHIKNSLYMDVERSDIEDELIGGFPLFANEDFLIMSKIYDFHNDGIIVLRIKDITDISPFGQKNFIENICKKDGDSQWEQAEVMAVHG